MPSQSEPAFDKSTFEPNKEQGLTGHWFRLRWSIACVPTKVRFQRNAVDLDPGTGRSSLPRLVPPEPRALRNGRRRPSALVRFCSQHSRATTRHYASRARIDIPE
jgi:hypothetical protein